MHTPIN